MSEADAELSQPQDYSDSAATFGDRIAAAREGMGLSGRDLAQRLGVAEKTLTAWEEDRAEPRANKLQMLAGLLNVSIIWLMSGEGQGVDMSGAVIAPEEVEAILAELREIRTQQQTLAVRTQRLERRLSALVG